MYNLPVGQENSASIKRKTAGDSIDKSSAADDQTSDTMNKHSASCLNLANTMMGENSVNQIYQPTNISSTGSTLLEASVGVGMIASRSALIIIPSLHGMLRFPQAQFQSLDSMVYSSIPTINRVQFYELSLNIECNMADSQRLSFSMGIRTLRIILCIQPVAAKSQKKIFSMTQ